MKWPLHTPCKIKQTKVIVCNRLLSSYLFVHKQLTFIHPLAQSDLHLLNLIRSFLKKKKKKTDVNNEYSILGRCI